MEGIRRRAKKSLMYQANSYQTICETMRLIYDEIHDMPQTKWKEKITDLLIDGMIIGKKMQNRLIYYHQTYKDTSGSGGSNIGRLKGSKKRSRMRKARKNG